MGSRWDPWVIQAAPAQAPSGAYPQYLFPREARGVKPDRLKFQAPNLSLPEGWSPERLHGSTGLLAAIERQQHALDGHAAVAGFDRQRQQALSLLDDAKVKRAFDVCNADPGVQDRYGRNSFGWSLLMAHRLIEAGVNLVQVNLGNVRRPGTRIGSLPALQGLPPPADGSCPFRAARRSARHRAAARQHAGGHGRRVRPDAADVHFANDTRGLSAAITGARCRASSWRAAASPAAR